MTRIVQDTQRGVTGIGEPTGGLEHTREHHLKIKLLKNAAGDAENAFGG